MSNNEELMYKPGHKGPRRVISAWHFSMKGLSAAWRHEEAIRMEFCLLLILLPIAFWLGDSTLEVVLLVLVCALVLITELLNSALEAIVDRISTEKHPLSGQAKDIGSAAVFMSMVTFLFVWLAFLFKKLQILPL